jgi:hypothetical protein
MGRSEEQGVDLGRLGHGEGGESPGLQGLAEVKLGVLGIEFLAKHQDLRKADLAGIDANQVPDQGLGLELHHPVVHQEKQVCISPGLETPDSRGCKVKGHKL